MFTHAIVKEFQKAICLQLLKNGPKWLSCTPFLYISLLSLTSDHDASFLSCTDVP